MIKNFIQWITKPVSSPHCKVCEDTKEIEVLVMGTDFEFVECHYCKNTNNGNKEDKDNL